MHHRRLLLALATLTTSAHAVVVRGRVTTPFGVPVPYARVVLIQGTRAVGDTISAPDGTYEIRTTLSGRFLLLTSRSPLVQIGAPFYAGALDLLTRDIALSPNTIYPTPPASNPTQVIVIAPPQLLPYATLLPELRPLPATFLLERGATGSPAYLYTQGASPAQTQIRIADVSAEDLGGRFNLATLSTSGLAALTLASALTLTEAPSLPDAEAATLTLHTPLAETLHPTLLYTGDAGPLATLRNEAVAAATFRRADLLASFARFDTANGNRSAAVPYHIATTAANAGYHISAVTSFRATFRQDVSAVALAPFFGVARSGKDANQDLYASATFTTSTARNWTNTLRYGLARKREQSYLFIPIPTQLLTVNGTTALVTLPGAPPREDQATNRDEATYLTDSPFRPWLHPALTLRYQNERALDQAPSYRQTLTRTHLTALPTFSGDLLRHRLFYTAASTLDYSRTYHFNAAPILGLTYAPVRPSPRRFRGTILRATAATAFREPSLLESITPATPRARTYTLAADQQILPNLTLTGTYFHHQFSHDYELRTQSSSTQQAAFTPTLAYRTQGVTLDLHYHPYPRIQLAAGYTYLASLVEQSATTTGLLTAVAGARPFHRPPNTAFATAQYAGPRFTAVFKATLAGRSDDSTTLATLQLPNRNLSPGWVSLDTNASLVLTHRITAFTTLTNLTDSRTIAPIGYTSTPFLVRAGLRIRLGKE